MSEKDLRRQTYDKRDKGTKKGKRKKKRQIDYLYQRDWRVSQHRPKEKLNY